MIADGGDALHPPVRRDIARVEEQGVAYRRLLQVLIDDLRERNGRLPLPVCTRHRRKPAAVDERELPALKQHAAIARWETPSARGTIRDNLAHSKLAGQRLALRFEIDAGSEAF